MNPNPLQPAATVLQGLSKTLGNLQTANVLLDRLEKSVSISRACRAPDVHVSGTVIESQTLPDGSGVPLRATAVTGTNGYKTRIVFQPKQGFNCTCPDLQQRRAACKHVAALAVECRKRFWAVMDLMEADAERIAIQITELEAAANSLASKANSALDSSLRALES